MSSIPQWVSETAIERAPVEIWNHILALAVACPLLPSDDDSLVESLYLLQYDCETISDYCDSERFRLSCRLVCRSWQKLLDEYSHRLFLGSSLHNLGSRIEFCQRIQFYSMSKWARCHHDYGIGTCSSLTRRGQPPTQNTQAVDSSVVRAFIDPGNGWGHAIMDTLSSFPRLQLLSQWFHSPRSPEHPTGTKSLPQISLKCATLTHLALYGFYQSAIGEDQVLTLPNLHTLFIHAIHARKKRIPPFGKWQLPSLRNLAICGEMQKSRDESYDQVQLLIQNVGATLTGLSLSWKWGYVKERVPSQLREWCPHLQSLETSIANVCEMWQLSQMHFPLKFILTEFRQGLTLGSSFTPFDELHRTISGEEGAGLDGISFGMPISWSALRGNLSACVDQPPGARIRMYLPHSLLPLLYQFLDSGYPFTDRYGVGIDSTEALIFMEWLERIS